MSFESRLMESATEATGDETITDVAEFLPKGMTGAQMAGAAAGSLVGGGATDGSAWGSGLGAAAGMYAAQVATGEITDLPDRMCVAVSPTEVYVLAMPNLGVAHLEPIAKIDRDKLGVEVHNKRVVRTVILEDLETGNKIPLEAKKVNVYHSKAMIEMLMLADQHQDEEQYPEPAEA